MLAIFMQKYNAFLSTHIIYLSLVGQHIPSKKTFVFRSITLLKCLENVITRKKLPTNAIWVNLEKKEN